MLRTVASFVLYVIVNFGREQDVKLKALLKVNEDAITAQRAAVADAAKAAKATPTPAPDGKPTTAEAGVDQRVDDGKARSDGQASLAGSGDVFEGADADGSGTIDEGEFTSLMGQLELEVQTGEMPKVFASIDTDGSGTIALDEFVACKSAQPAQSDWSVWLVT